MNCSRSIHVFVSLIKVNKTSQAEVVEEPIIYHDEAQLPLLWLGRSSDATLARYHILLAVSCLQQHLERFKPLCC